MSKKARSLKNLGDDCVICAGTGSIVLKRDAVCVSGKWYRREIAPKETLAADKSSEKKDKS